MAGAETTPFIFQLVEALAAISIPLGGGMAAYAKWRRSADRERRAREEAARVASERAALLARDQEKEMRDRLLGDKDSQIIEVRAQLEAERAENERLHKLMIELLQ